MLQFNAILNTQLGERASSDTAFSNDLDAQAFEDFLNEDSLSSFNEPVTMSYNPQQGNYIMTRATGSGAITRADATGGRPFEQVMNEVVKTIDAMTTGQDNVMDNLAEAHQHILNFYV